MSDIVRLFGDFAIDPARGCLLRAGQPLHLRPQAYKALKYLADNRGRLMTKDQIIEEVWEGRAVTDDSLVQCLRDVRQALGENSHYLRNERGRGYILEQPPETIRTAVPAAARPWSRRYLAVGVVAALAAAAVALVYVSRFAGQEAPIRSVAVLPFENGTGDSDLDYLSDGLSERLIDRLSQLPGMTVIARSSSFTFRGSDTDVMKAAKALGARAVVTGRILRRGDQMEIRAELVDTQARTQVWGERYAGRTVDVQEVQESIVRSIADRLRLRVGGGQPQQLARQAPHNPQAYELYLNGLFHGAKGGSRNNATALDHYTKAVALDPDFALAWAQMAKTHATQATMSWREPTAALAQATSAAHKALELDPSLADAHVALASLRQHEWDWAGAERAYRRGLDLNPSLADAHQRYSRYLSTVRRHADALAEIRRAQELAPLQINLRVQEGLVLLLARRYDEALERLQRVVALDPANRDVRNVLGFTYAAKGWYAQAITELEPQVRVHPAAQSLRCYLGYALAMAGRTREAEALLATLTTSTEYVSPAELAVIYVGLGDFDGAIAALERAYAAHDLQMQLLQVDPHYDRIRQDARFQAIERRLAFPR